MREIRVDHVSKSFGKAKALDDVSLSFEHGKIHALLGRNGAGKSTLLNTIMGKEDRHHFQHRPDHPPSFPRGLHSR